MYNDSCFNVNIKNEFDVLIINIVLVRPIIPNTIWLLKSNNSIITITTILRVLCLIPNIQISISLELYLHGLSIKSSVWSAVACTVAWEVIFSVKLMNNLVFLWYRSLKGAQHVFMYGGHASAWFNTIRPEGTEIRNCEVLFISIRNKASYGGYRESSVLYGEIISEWMFFTLFTGPDFNIIFFEGKKSSVVFGDTALRVFSR